jgi:hypothetical protein
MHNAATRRTSRKRRAAAAAAAAAEAQAAARGSVISTFTFADNEDEEDEMELRPNNGETETETETETGGAAAEQHEPLLDSFDSYIVVSVLTATASFAALFEASNPNNENHADASSMTSIILHNISVLTCSICSLSGIYATVVFSFSSIYGRTAVGTGKIDIYEEFLINTEIIRYKAFLMYLLSLILFIVLLVITATTRIHNEYQLYFVTLLIILSIISYNDWNTIIKCAAPIFADEDNNVQKQQQPISQSRSSPHAVGMLSKTKSKKYL